MAKKFILVKLSEVTKVQMPQIDWNLRILCRNDSSEPLSQPWKSRGRGKCAGTGYQSFAANLAKFNDLGKILFGVSSEQFDDISGVVETLQKNKAYWQKCIQ